MSQKSIKIVILCAILCSLSLSLQAVLNCATYDSKNCIACNDGYTLIEDSVYYQNGIIYYCVLNEYLPQNCSPSLTGVPYIYKNNPNLYKINLNAGDQILVQTLNINNYNSQVNFDIEFYQEGYTRSNQIYCACNGIHNNVNGFRANILQNASYYIYIVLKDTNTPQIFTGYILELTFDNNYFQFKNGLFPTDTANFHQFQCAVYNPGYLLKTDLNGQNICIQSVTSCAQFAGDSAPTNSKCIRCYLGWILNFQPNICIPLVEFCSNYNGQICTSCIDKYILFNSKCVQIPLNCFNYSLTTGACLNCSVGYVLNSNKQCVINSSCPDYYYRYLETNSCIKGSIINCKKYFVNGLCQECESNYQLDSLGYNCLIISTQLICPNNTNTFTFVLIMKNCVKVDKNCNRYLEDGYCYDCMDNFYQFNGLCYQNSNSTNK